MFCYTHRSISCPAIITRLPLAPDWSRYRIPQPVNMWWNSKLDVSIMSLPSETDQGIPQRKGRKIATVRDTKRTWPTESIKQGSHRLTETEVANPVPTWVRNRSSVPMLWLLVSCSYDTPKSRSGYISYLGILGCFWVYFTSTGLPCPASIWLLLSCLVSCFVLSAVFWRWPALLKKQRGSGLWVCAWVVELWVVEKGKTGWNVLKRNENLNW